MRNSVFVKRVSGAGNACLQAGEFSSSQFTLCTSEENNQAKAD
jgi:hypothetical protein